MFSEKLRNWAYLRKVTESSTEHETGVNIDAQMAVDGAKETDQLDMCSITQKEKDPWWSVTFRQTLDVLGGLLYLPTPRK